ncbi:cytochrome b/b6 domain-containing protein [Pedobacter boryungensis]|uniref:Cytochrome b/b6 domain-containing protein n=1 Tax=Pedobacter boryungensis TaxID=869962 RepID=A0ABX2DF72_9SPHI|nr:cytochrome b/b6 domain-containing protein [Pedobacter boryungensis]NQX31616.1 cytochrome b/b6 domain-containing protein [Pedobacter boryungensis]
MRGIEPNPKGIENRSPLKKNAASLRLWHWLSALVICGSLITVLINSTLLDRGNSGLVKQELVQAGAQVDDQQARAVIHGMEDQVWGIHTYFGYTLAALLVFRIISELFQDKNQRLFNKLKTAYQNYIVKPKERRLARHELLTKALYLAYYFLLTLMVITGICIAFDKELGISKSLSHQLKEIHGFIMYLIIAFIIVHIFGVFLAERKEGKGIVSDMINGG